MDDGILEVIKLRFDECMQAVSKVEAMAHSGANFKVAMDSLLQRVETLRQEVAEYRAWKDPKDHEQKMIAYMGLVDNLSNKVADMGNRLNQFEQKEWMRILSDEELTNQVKLSGKTLKDIADKFVISVEMAHKYRVADIKDIGIRWKIYRFCGGA